MTIVAEQRKKLIVLINSRVEGHNNKQIKLDTWDGETFFTEPIAEIL